MAINTLIHTRGECCPHPLPGDMRHTLFPEVEFNRMERARHRAVMRVDKHSARTRRQREKREVQEDVQYHQALQQAAIDLNFQSPETFVRWNQRHSGLREADWFALFWRWQRRFASLSPLDWLRYGHDPRHVVVMGLQDIVRETPEAVRAQERWLIPNKLRDLTL